jgi:hypothetical protein
MKKTVTFILAILMVLALAACGGQSQQAPENTPQVNLEEGIPPEAGEGEEAPWPYAFSQEHIQAIANVLVELEPLYNKAALLALENGWDADELTVKELNTVYALVEAGKYGVADPGDYGETTDEQMAVLAEQYQVILDAMPDVIERVSVPYDEGSGGDN